MKSIINQILALFFIAFTFTAANAQVQNVTLEQTDGAFVVEALTLSQGDYQFNIANNGVDREVGFVLVPKGKYAPENHIKAAYVKAPVAKGKSSKTDIVSLKAGEYEYFCPLNPTPKYSLTVSAVEKVKLTQVPGEFQTKNLTLAEGEYEFEIANEGVGKEVGFVLVPKGKYAPENHIKAAYVKAPVVNPTPKYALTVAAGEKVKLTQVPGEFQTKNLTLEAGQYEFEIANNGVGKEVGFVLVPEGKYAPENHIKAAYVKAPVATGKSSKTNVVNLKAGTYEYFCPLNPTPKYKLTVK